MNDFTKDLAQGLFNQEKLNDTLCKLLKDKLPDGLSDQQKSNKVKNLLQSLKKAK